MYGFCPPPAQYDDTDIKANTDSLWVTGSSRILNNLESKGLSFTEFMELIGRLALDGMEQECYNRLFPTPFSKLLAVLTVWGVADLKKVDEIRVLHGLKQV